MSHDAFSFVLVELKFFRGLAEVFLLINLFFQLSQNLEFSHRTVSESHPYPLPVTAFSIKHILLMHRKCHLK